MRLTGHGVMNLVSVCLNLLIIFQNSFMLRTMLIFLGNILLKERLVYTAFEKLNFTIHCIVFTYEYVSDCFFLHCVNIVIMI